MQSESEDAAVRLYDLADVFRPWAIRAAATLRLADHIAKGCQSIAQLADATNSDPDALGRLLRYLKLQGIFSEEPNGYYGLTETGAALLEDHPARLRRWLDQEAGMGRADTAAAGLLQSVRDGLPSYSRFFGAGFWEDLGRHPDQRRAFDKLMADQIDLRAPQIANAYEWQDVHEVVDVGGGTGILLAAILERAGHLRGTLVELPETAELGRELIRARNLSDRVTIAACSFFEQLPQGADVYILNNVLHDWSDADAIAILQKCAAAVAPAGRVLVIESPRSPRAESLVSTMDLYMLTLFGGKERSLEEFDRLIVSADLCRSGIAARVGSRVIIECSRRVITV